MPNITGEVQNGTEIFLGTHGIVTKNQQEAGTITLQIAGAAIVLSHNAAEKLLVETVETG